MVHLDQLKKEDDAESMFMENEDIKIVKKGHQPKDSAAA